MSFLRKVERVEWKEFQYILKHYHNGYAGCGGINSVSDPVLDAAGEAEARGEGLDARG